MQKESESETFGNEVWRGLSGRERSKQPRVEGLAVRTQRMGSIIDTRGNSMRAKERERENK